MGTYTSDSEIDTHRNIMGAGAKRHHGHSGSVPLCTQGIKE